MPIPSSISDLSTTASSNSPSGGDSPGDGDDYIRAQSAFIAQLRDKLNGTAATGTIKQPAFDGTASGTLIGATLTTPTLTTPTLNGAVTFGEGWSLDTSGRMRNTSNEQPHFYAYMSGTTNQSSGTEILFNSETTDQGGIYNNASGIFTAPVAGVYMMTANAVIRNRSGSTMADSLVMVGSTFGTIAAAILDQADQVDRTCHMSAVVRLAASETVSVKLASGAGWSNSSAVVYNGWSTLPENYFSGALLF